MADLKINTSEMSDKFLNEFENFKKQTKRPNILLLGQTGVGKSSLVNSIFGGNLAKISDIKPETRGFHYFSDQATPINIVDSEGYELEKSETFVPELKEFIQSSFLQQEKQIHLAWYCVATPSSRVLPFDIENIKVLRELEVPVAVVFTKTDMDNPDLSISTSMAKVINESFNGNVPVFKTSNDKETNELLDLSSLVTWSIDNISDENLKKGFIIAQKISLDKKDIIAKNRVKYYAGAAAAIGAAPIPGSDAVYLTALQMTMTADIFHIYGIENSIGELTRNFIQSKIVSALGKTIAGNLLKLIPGFGTVAGAAINATVAATITYSMGNAMCKIAKTAIERQLGSGGLEELFTEENLNKVFDKAQKEVENN